MNGSSTELARYRAVPGPMQTSARTGRAQEHNIKSNTVI